METVEEVLAHHGVRGQKWGVRRDRSESASSKAPSSDDFKRADAARAKAKSSGGTHALSNKELQDAVTRMNLEQQYSRLASSDKKSGAGKKFAKELLVNVAKQQVTQLANKQAAEVIAKQLAKKTVKTAVKAAVVAAV